MLYFHGFGHFHPENEIDNSFLESLDIGVTESWITERVGIKTRRTVLPLDYIRTTKNHDVRAARQSSLYSNAETGRRAAMMALSRAGLQPSDIGLVIAGGCSPDTSIPAEAARIANALGISVPAFDLHSASSTFGAHLHYARQMAQSLPDFTLLVSAENTTRVTNYADRTSAILFGDATSAVVVSCRQPASARTDFTTFDANPQGCDEISIQRVSHFVQNGSVVQKFAIKRMTTLLKEIKDRTNPTNNLIFVGHQGNLAMLESVCRRCEWPNEQHLHNVVDYGNQAAAGAPSVISQHWDTFRPGDTLAVTVVGSGLSWASVQIDFV